MKNYKYSHDKSIIKIDYSELLELKFALANEIRKEVELNKYLGTKFGFYNSDKTLVNVYKKIIKAFKSYQ